MSKGKDYLIKKWNITKEQLVALCALNKLPKRNEDFAKLLEEDIQLKNLNSQLFSSLCYYILGIIDSEERDKLIRWPLINIKTHADFRKGVTALVNGFQEKYPWAHIKKLPGTYFMRPNGYDAKVVDFISKLTNLAIHIALNDPEILLMHSGNGLNSRDFGIMREIISKATQNEEELLRRNVLSLKDFEDAKKEVCMKCITLKQANDDLQHQLNNLTAHAVSEGIMPSGKKFEIEDLRELREKKLSELNNINEELSKYYNNSQELLSRIKAVKNPMSLSAKDFGCESSSPDLIEATSKACGNLYQLFQYVTSKSSAEEEENNFYEKAKIAKKCLADEKKALESFLSKMSSLKP